MIDKVDKVFKEIMEINIRVDKNSMVLLRELSSRIIKFAFFICIKIFLEGEKGFGVSIYNKYKFNLKF